jgi:hypothetical protein
LGSVLGDDVKNKCGLEWWTGKQVRLGESEKADMSI